jgi:hypothetical protein
VVAVEERVDPPLVSYELQDDEGQLLECIEHALLDEGWWKSFRQWSAAVASVVTLDGRFHDPTHLDDVRGTAHRATEGSGASAKREFLGVAFGTTKGCALRP